jgi:hypothetical protein
MYCIAFDRKLLMASIHPNVSPFQPQLAAGTSVKFRQIRFLAGRAFRSIATRPDDFKSRFDGGLGLAFIVRHQA